MAEEMVVKSVEYWVAQSAASLAECWAVHLVAYLALWSVGTRAGLSVGTMVDKTAAESAGSLGAYWVVG